MSVLPSDKKRLLLADLTLLYAALIWGTTFAVIKHALQFANPFLFMTMRFGLALAIITLLASRSLRSLNRRELIGGFFTGLSLYLGFTFQTWGLVYTAASKSAFITGLNVVLVPFILWSIGHQHIRGKRWVAAGLAVVGLLLLTDPTGAGGVNLGDFLTFFCAIAFAAQIVLLGFYSPSTNTLRYFWVQLVTITVLSALSTSIVDGWQITPSLDLWIGLGITGIGGTALAFLGMTWAQKYAQPTRAALIITLEPVFGALFAVFIAGEFLSTSAWFGGGLIVAMIIWSELGGSNSSLPTDR